MSAATCQSCGSTFAPAYDRIFCGSCELNMASLVPRDATVNARGRRQGAGRLAEYVDGNCLGLGIAPSRCNRSGG